MSKKSLLIIVVLVLAAAAAFFMANRNLTGWEIERLRADYPTFDGSSLLSDKLAMKEVPEYIAAGAFETFVEYTVSGDIRVRKEEMRTVDSKGGDDAALTKINPGFFNVTSTFYDIPVTTKSVLWGKAVEKEIILSINAALIDEAAMSQFKPGATFASFIKEWSGVHEGKYSFGDSFTFYVTDADYLLSMSPENPMNKYSGMKIDKFSNQVVTQFDSYKSK